jgi:hypothetical protein
MSAAGSIGVLTADVGVGYQQFALRLPPYTFERSTLNRTSPTAVTRRAPPGDAFTVDRLSVNEYPLCSSGPELT